MNSLWFEILVFPGLVFLLGWTFFVFYFARKMLALIHKRWGPHENGPAGTLQTIYDVFKLMGKENIVPKSADPILFTVIPVITPLVAILPVILIPWTPLINNGAGIVNTKWGVLGLVILIGVEPFLLFLTGFGSNNKYSFMGGMRILTQMVSMEAPFFLAALSPAILFGTMNLHDIMYSNTWLTSLILLPGAILFIIAMLGILEQPPFNIPDAEQEIVYGFYTEYSGIGYTLLKFAEFTEILVVSASAVVLFFGGYRGLFFDSFVCLLLKIFALAFIMVAIRASNPRLRLDQMLKFAWSWLVPLSVLNLVWIIIAKLYILS